eukprot:scaffold38353_cov31-Tisochrysis_lutea.AAC.6
MQPGQPPAALHLHALSRRSAAARSSPSRGSSCSMIPAPPARRSKSMSRSACSSPRRRVH